MARQPAKKVSVRHADITSIPSFVFPKNEALNKEMAKASNSPRTRPSFEYIAPPSPSIQLLTATTPREPAAIYSYAGRDYPSFAHAKAANPTMQQISNPPSAAGEYQARRGREFLNSIGSGAFGLGPMSYVMGGAPEAIQASMQFDEALGGLAVGRAIRAPVRLSGAREGRQPAEAFLRSRRWSSLADQLIDSNGVLPVARGEIGTQDIARASKAMNHELAYLRNRTTGQRQLLDVGNQLGQVPANSRLIMHSHPGTGFSSVIPSQADRHALKALGQKSSIIINFDGTKSVRFRPESRNDGSIWQYENGKWVFPDE